MKTFYVCGYNFEARWMWMRLTQIRNKDDGEGALGK